MEPIEINVGGGDGESAVVDVAKLRELFAVVHVAMEQGVAAMQWMQDVTTTMTAVPPPEHAQTMIVGSACAAIETLAVLVEALQRIQSALLPEIPGAVIGYLNELNDGEAEPG